jgi:acyl-CoA thioesterase I
MKINIYAIILTMVLLFSTFLACQTSPYANFELDYLKSIKPQTKKPLIIAFGNSFTRGYTNNLESSYPKLLENTLNENNCEYEVLNFGFNGDTTDKAIHRIQYALNFPDTKLFILELGANDLMKKVEISKIKNNLQNLINEIKEKDIKIILCGFDASKKTNFEYSENAKKMFVELSNENEIPLIPSFLQDVTIEKNLMIEDHIHPNQSGINIIKNNIYVKIKPLLQCEK